VRLVRSWPLDPPEHHARVQDQLERVLTRPFDYRPLVALGEDLVHLDWDIAVSPGDLATFAARARASPSRVLVGPYLSYPGSLFGHDPVPRDIPDPVWTAKVYTDSTETQMRNVTVGDPECHLFGFGMVYLPHAWLAAFDDQHPDIAAWGRGQVPPPAACKMGDGQFSGWYYRQAGPAALCWEVIPVHLNFPPPVL